MLALYGITSFVQPETIEKVITFSSKNKKFFQTENVSITDHTGESGTLTFLFTPPVEITLAPCNSFHYQGDFEIGLSVDPDFQISDLETLLSENGFQYESGHFENNREKSYYLIPRRNGISTPFFIISEGNTRENRFLPTVKRIKLQIDREKLSTAEEFIDLVGLRKTVEMDLVGGDKNRVMAIVSEIKENHGSKKRIQLDDIEMIFDQNVWEIRTG